MENEKNSPNEHLLSLPFHKAVEEKWKLGQIKYGPKFVGHPLANLFEELLDIVNYCNEAKRWGYEEPELSKIFNWAWRAGLEIQSMWCLRHLRIVRPDGECDTCLEELE